MKLTANDKISINTLRILNEQIALWCKHTEVTALTLESLHSLVAAVSDQETNISVEFERKMRVDDALFEEI